MDMISHWNILFQQNTVPCFIADAQNQKVIYMNFEMQKLLGENNDAQGKPFYQVIHDDSNNSNNLKLDFSKNDIQEFEIFNKALNAEFKVTLVLDEYKNNPCIFCKYVSTENQDNNEHSFDIAVSKCVSILQEDLECRNDELLRVLGEYYLADKTYLYKIDKEHLSIPCVSHWRKNENIKLNFDISTIIDAKRLIKWFESRNEVGIIEASKHVTSYTDNSIEAEVLKAFNLENLIMYIIEDQNHDAVGVIAISNREKIAIDLRLVQVVAQFMKKDEITNANKNDFDLDKISDVDMLTGFHNRISYSQKMDQLSKNPPKTLGVVFADVNGLKKVNNEYGYAKGDSYIKQVSKLLLEYFKVDFYRITGDEFVAFFEDVDKDEFNNKVLTMQENLRNSDTNYFALGFAYAKKRVNVVELVKEADTIMYINKQEYYHSSRHSFGEISDNTLSELLSYLHNDEFMIYLQPQVNLSDGSLYGAEALVRRFDKKNQKMVFPDQFISLYERKSIIRHIDIFVIEEVCKLLQELIKKGCKIPISVNLSRVTLQEYGIVETIARICDKYKIPRELLVIEVTERVGLVENNVASSLILDFKQHGFKISLDDFGCAYSNIVILAQIDVDEVKLDKSLVDFLTTNKKNHVLVRSVLRMCKELNETSTLAEGIEDEEQAKLLYELGCHLGQGYFYSRPIPVKEFCEKYTK